MAWVKTVARLERFRKQHSVILMDHGCFQTLWTIGYGADPDRWCRVVPAFRQLVRPPDLLVIVDADPATAIRRLQRRRQSLGPTSRIQNDDLDSDQTRNRLADFTAQISLAAIEPASARFGFPILRLDNDRDEYGAWQAEQLAEAIAQGIRRRPSASPQSIASAYAERLSRGTVSGSPQCLSSPSGRYAGGEQSKSHKVEKSNIERTVEPAGSREHKNEGLHLVSTNAALSPNRGSGLTCHPEEDRSANSICNASAPSLVGVLPTYRRPEQLLRALEIVLGGTRVPDALIVVDNGRQARTAEILREVVQHASVSVHCQNLNEGRDREGEARVEPASPERLGRSLALPVCQSELVRALVPELVQPKENLGSAGGWACGMRHVLDQLEPHDWILVLDDDDPPRSGNEVEQMWRFALEQHALDPAVVAVGIVGARFDWQKGMLRRLRDDEIDNAVDVDYVGSGHIPMYRVSALREVGVFRDELFFGHTEVEFGLRLRKAGYRVVANGELWKVRRELDGRAGVHIVPRRLCEVSSRRYYVIRNHVYMMRQFGRWDLALKHALVQTALKPLFTLCCQPLLAIRGFFQGLRASRDGFFGRMGRRLDPTPTRTSDDKARGSEGYTD